MFKLVLVSLLIYSQFAFGQVDYVKKDDTSNIRSSHKSPKEFQRKLSFQAFVGGSGSGNQFAPTGYHLTNGQDIEMRTNGGFSSGLKVSYTLSNKIEVELGYEYQLSELRWEIGNGTGKFDRHIASPVLKYVITIAPKEMALYFYAGANLIIGSRMKTEVNYQNSNDNIECIYNPSLGGIIGTELELYSGRLFSMRFGLNHNINHMKINRAYHNDNKIATEFLDTETQKFYSNSAFIYIGGVFNIKWTQKLNR